MTYGGAATQQIGIAAPPGGAPLLRFCPTATSPDVFVPFPSAGILHRAQLTSWRRKMMLSAQQSSAPPGLRARRVNDIHSRLNATRIERILYPDSVEALARIIRRAGRQRKAISVA
ncbi:MAG TPA: hypothetical protein VGR27_02555, partial [Longimicrobiaceae bacterium]|nr:hypothetical protein [Longimicrobiaceae bacterium]